jgi:ribosome biogenesis GTPase / thiamine phosphate phosphatase
MQGLITKSTGSWYQVQTPEGEKYNCRIKGIFRTKGIRTTNPIAVGDIVDFEPEPEQETGVISHLHPRKNYIIRKSVNLSKQGHIRRQIWIRRC